MQMAYGQYEEFRSGSVEDVAERLIQRRI